MSSSLSWLVLRFMALRLAPKACVCECVWSDKQNQGSRTRDIDETVSQTCKLKREIVAEIDFGEEEMEFGGR